MKQRGFTLIELMAVIAILAIIATITVPIIQSTLNGSKQKTCESQITVIENAAKRWVTDVVANGSATLPTVNGASICKNVSELYFEGYLGSKEIKNPIDNSTISGCVTITYDSAYKQYTYNYAVADVCNID